MHPSVPRSKYSPTFINVDIFWSLPTTFHCPIVWTQYKRHEEHSRCLIGCRLCQHIFVRVGALVSFCRIYSIASNELGHSWQTVSIAQKFLWAEFVGRSRSVESCYQRHVKHSRHRLLSHNNSGNFDCAAHHSYHLSLDAVFQFLLCPVSLVAVHSQVQSSRVSGTRFKTPHVLGM